MCGRPASVPSRAPSRAHCRRVAAQVYKVRSKQSGRTLAMKSIAMGAEDDTGKALKEARLLAELNHPNIVRYYDSFVDDRKLCLVMTYCSGGDLYGHVRK